MKRLIAYKKKWDDEGVVSTVGTIMALLVFLTFLSMIVNSYVPVWMKDSESSHMNVAYGQFGDLKQSIDTQMLFARMSDIAGQAFTATTIFSPVTLGVDGVPIFSAPTIGELTADQAKGPWNAWFKYYPNKVVNTTQVVNETAAGAIRLEVFNRYFIQQSLVYENGAVIKYQSDGMVLRAQPTFEVRLLNNTEEITVVMLSLIGFGSQRGTTKEGVHSKVVSVSMDEYKRVHTDIYINHTSQFGLAWWAFYNATIAKAFGITPDKYASCTAEPTGYCYTVQKQAPWGIKNQMIRSPYFKLTIALNTTSLEYVLTLRLKNDYLNQYINMPIIKTFRIMKVIVNVAVGGIGAQVNI